MNVTFTHLTTHLHEIATELRIAHPAWSVRVEGAELWLRGAACSGHVEPRYESATSTVRVVALFGSGIALVGDLDEVGRGLDEYRAMHEVLSSLRSRFEGMTVVLEGGAS